MSEKNDRLCGQSSWLQIQSPEFDSRRYQIFWEVVGLEFGQENRINDRGDPLRWPRDTLYPQKLSLTSPTSGCRSVGIIRLRTKSHGV
jgi:hypothetical protein